MNETQTIDSRRAAAVRDLSTRDLWRKFWMNANRADDLTGFHEEVARGWADECWGELVRRGVTMWQSREDEATE